MDRYFTVMVVPEREKGVKSFRVPRVIFHGFLFFLISSLILVGILVFNYWNVLRQVYENKHLTIENRQLKEQVQLFQMKINLLSDDIERIQNFERKLRVMTGLNIQQLQVPLKGDANGQSYEGTKKGPKKIAPDQSSLINTPSVKDLMQPKVIQNHKRYKKIKSLYEQKIASVFGFEGQFSFTKQWNELTNKSFYLAEQYAKFDYKFDILKKHADDLEVQIHELDQRFLDNESYLRSTPSILPANGWVTSYYGPRISPITRRLRMHEGIDIGARIGAGIFSPADGIVTFSGTKPGFGKFVKVDHGYGIETVFGHAKKLNVKKGKKVSRGDILAFVGNTGYSTGPHLHYEVRVNGTPVDPLYFVFN